MNILSSVDSLIESLELDLQLSKKTARKSVEGHVFNAQELKTAILSGEEQDISISWMRLRCSIHDGAPISQQSEKLWDEVSAALSHSREP